MFKQHVNLLIWTWIFVHLTMGVNSFTNRNLCKNLLLLYSCLNYVWVFCLRSSVTLLMMVPYFRSGSRISGKDVRMFGLGVHFADFISIFLDIPWKWNNLVSLRPNYFIFIGYLKTGVCGGGGGWRGFKRTHWTPSGPTNYMLVSNLWLRHVLVILAFWRRLEFSRQMLSASAWHFLVSCCFAVADFWILTKPTWIYH